MLEALRIKKGTVIEAISTPVVEAKKISEPYETSTSDGGFIFGLFGSSKTVTKGEHIRYESNSIKQTIKLKGKYSSSKVRY